jgi:NAD-dependent deacetylase
MAGSRKILELHGNIRVDRCSRCGVETEAVLNEVSPTVSKCPCGGLLRPGVVWFGENLPEAVLEQAYTAARQCRLFLSIGTSNFVYPAAELPFIAQKSGAMIIEVNTEETPLTHIATYHFRGRSGVVLPELLAAWKSARSAKPMGTSET